MVSGRLSTSAPPSALRDSPHLVAMNSGCRTGASVGADEFLVLADLVAGRGIEMIDTGIHRSQQRGARFVVVARAVPADQPHATETDGRNAA